MRQEVLPMNMVDLILTVCLIAKPAECHDEHLYFESHGALFQCMWFAPQEIAKWVGDHPGRKVVRWKCEFPDKGRAI
jgi:hypothetical protein